MKHWNIPRCLISEYKQLPLYEDGQHCGEWSLGADPEFSFRADGFAMSGDVAEELGCVDRPGVQRGNLG